MPFYVYVLKSQKDGKRYIGFTDDLSRRLLEHNSGKVTSIRNRRPLNFVYTEEYLAKEDAMNREKFFKTHSGRNYLDSMGK